MKEKNNDLIMQNRVFIWLALVVGFILLIPMFGKWPWTLSDFIFAGALLFGAGFVFLLAARKWRKHRVIIGFVVAAALLYLWAELAVGIFTTWGS